MAKKYMKIFSSLITRKMQIKTTVRHYLTPVRRAIIKRLEKTSVGKDVWSKKDHLAQLMGNWRSHYGKQYGGSSKN